MANNVVVPASQAKATLQAMLEKARPALASVLPKHLNAERLAKLAVIAASRSPQLLACTPTSFLGAVMQAADLGLEPNTSLGLAYLVPFKNKKAGGQLEVQFIPGYRGLIRLAVQSGEIKSLHARVIYKNDTYDVEFGTSPRLTHKPCLEGDRGELVAVYSVAIFKDGGEDVEFMTRAEVEKIRQRSASPEDGPWKTDFEEMARKTVIRKHAKNLPLSTENFGRALQHQAQVEAGAGPDFSDVSDALSVVEAPTEPEAPTKADALKAKIAAQAAQAEAEQPVGAK